MAGPVEQRRKNAEQLNCGMRNAECGLGKTEPRDCRLRRTRTTGRGVGPLWREGWTSGGAGQGRVREWVMECENVRLCSLMFAYVRLIGEKLFGHVSWFPALRLSPLPGPLPGPL